MAAPERRANATQVAGAMAPLLQEPRPSRVSQENGRTPINGPCSQNANAAQAARPTTTVIGYSLRRGRADARR
jgi:hypothetical protein